MDQILAELFQAGGETLRSEIHKVINCTRNEDEFPEPVEGVYYYTHL
jgi:hypothetical protein